MTYLLHLTSQSMANGFNNDTRCYLKKTVLFATTFIFYVTLNRVFLIQRLIPPFPYYFLEISLMLINTDIRPVHI